jgi:SAM-dependent methyltransferase
VLGHYAPLRHPVIDKYEHAQGVRNVDAASFRDSARYDLIVSVSTLEHIGWDETPRAPERLALAVANLADHLAPGGRLLATMPLGYNRDLDALLISGALPFSRCCYLLRTGMSRWREAEWAEVEGTVYADRWPGASAVIIAFLER